ncbi:hypothetical protein RCL1_002678 [Eukaryota sp. TZLM3-RCL]
MWPNDNSSLLSILFFVAVYGWLVSKGSSFIAHGSEILSTILPAKFVGSFLVPIFGAFPDCAIIFIACFWSPPEDVVNDVQVSIGLLVGSTALLLCIAYAATIWIGRCDLLHDYIPNRKTAMDNECNGISFGSRQGIEINRATQHVSVWMICTCFSFPIISGVTAFVNRSHKEEDLFGELRMFYFVSIVCLFLIFTLFLLYCSICDENSTKLSFSLREKVLLNKTVKLMLKGKGSDLSTNPLNVDEVALEIAQKWRSKVQKHSIRSPLLASATPSSVPLSNNRGKSLTLFSGFGFILFGVTIVILFSDAIVESFKNFGGYFNVPPFFVSFVLGPLASNLSEVITGFYFARKKTSEQSSLSVSSFFGAVVMNNTLCFGVLMLSLYQHQIAFKFYAETICLFSLELIVGLLGLSRIQTMLGAVFKFLLYFVVLFVFFFLSSFVFV